MIHSPRSRLGWAKGKLKWCTLLRVEEIEDAPSFHANVVVFNGSSTTPEFLLELGGKRFLLEGNIAKRETISNRVGMTPSALPVD
jgi:hypothetical protein